MHALTSWVLHMFFAVLLIQHHNVKEQEIMANLLLPVLRLEVFTAYMYLWLFRFEFIVYTILKFL